MTIALLISKLKHRGGLYALAPFDHVIGLELWLRSLAGYPRNAGGA